MEISHHPCLENPQCGNYKTTHKTHLTHVPPSFTPLFIEDGMVEGYMANMTFFTEQQVQFYIEYKLLYRHKEQKKKRESTPLHTIHVW